MILRKSLWILVVVFLLSLGGISTVSAQQNLLQDPGFETTETYKRVGQDTDGTYYDVPPAWSGWIFPRSSGDPEWKNRVPTGFPHTGLFKIQGARSFHTSRGFATFTTSVFQTVSVPDKAKVQGSARGFMERGKQGEATPGGRFKVGIDPNGGSNPLDPAIVWSAEATNDDAWVQLTVDATANGTSVTLFLYATQSDPTDPNGIYWDDAILGVGGGGGTAGTPGTPGATPVPVVPTPAFASFVVPQAPQEDGSIIHTVQSGDTLAAIAVAYGTTNDEILSLNGLTSGRFLQIGQRLIIRQAAPGGSSSSDVAEEQGTEEVEAGATDEVEVVETEEVIGETEEVIGETEAVEPVVTEDTSAPTETPLPATDAPPAPVTQVAQNNASVTGICLSMFNDANQNRIREAGELLLASGKIMISAGGETVETYETDGSSEPFCLLDLDAGVYTVGAEAPEGFGLTGSPQSTLRVQSGVGVNLQIGAAQGLEAVVPPAADSGNEAPQAIIDETAETPEANGLLQNIGLIVFGLAGFVLIFGFGAALLLRRR
ncbi:MAG: LysM peptidoglycan-binding domain-containing protein [Anaerolineae bacterium]|nr:LysM peptidoglycan-binding domain-containing protein [Anaerolineae bacterium]